MVWKCVCGNSNHDEAFQCAGCGWSREQGKEDEFDGEPKQSGKDIKTYGEFKWEKYILSMIIFVFVFPVIENADLPRVLTVLIQLGSFIILFFLI